MPPESFAIGGLRVDLSSRVRQTTAVIASPAGAAETVIATTPAFDGAIPFALGVFLTAEVAYTTGATATAVTVRIRQGTGVAGTTVYSTGAMTGGHNAGALLVSDSAQGFDTAPAAGQQYSLTLLVTGATGASAVSAVSLVAIAV